MTKEKQIDALAAAANVSSRTVRRYLGGRVDTTPVVRAAIEAAARRLRVDLVALKKEGRPHQASRPAARR